MSSSGNTVLHRKGLSTHRQACGFYTTIYNQTGIIDLMEIIRMELK